MGLIESLIFQTHLSEVNAQPTIFPRKLISSYSELPNDFMIDLYIFVKAKYKRLIIRRLEVDFPDREHGVSSWNRGFIDVMKFSLNTLKKSLLIRLDGNYKT